MYISAFSIWFNKYGWKSFYESIKEVSNTTQKNKFVIAMDLILSNIFLGSTFQEYVNLEFYRRGWKNRNSFLTSYYNLRQYRKLNDKSFRRYFVDKSLFNKKFCGLIRRDWMNMDSSEEKVLKFLKEHSRVIIKPIGGDSGKNISIIDTKELLLTGNIGIFINDNKNSIIEEVLENHPALSELNESSLNTLRITSIVTKSGVEFLYAGIRVGRPGEVIDNISRGGRVAPIDILSGKVSGDLRSKKTSSLGLQYDDIGIDGSFTIPFWPETLDLVKSAAKVVPQMKYIAWDVAITSNGPAIIEGNHSSGNTINQIHFGIEQDGLKQKFKEILKLC